MDSENYINAIGSNMDFNFKSCAYVIQFQTSNGWQYFCEYRDLDFAIERFHILSSIEKEYGIRLLEVIRDDGLTATNIILEKYSNDECFDVNWSDLGF